MIQLSHSYLDFLGPYEGIFGASLHIFLIGAAEKGEIGVESRG